jgi:hypothetical protein
LLRARRSDVDEVAPPLRLIKRRYGRCARGGKGASKWARDR